MALLARHRPGGHGPLAAAEKELAALTPLLPHPSLDAPLFSPNPGRAILGIAPAVLAGEIAAARGDFDTAIAPLEHAVRLEDALVYTEPTEWAFPLRHALGAVLLEAGRPAEAETVYWEDLKRNRENGWSLTGLVQALRAQRKTRRPAIVEGAARQGVGRADVTLPRRASDGRPQPRRLRLSRTSPSRRRPSPAVSAVARGAPTDM